MTFDMFSELYDLLAQYKLGKDRHFNSISDRNQKALSGRLAIYFKNSLPDIVRLIEESQGITLRFDNYNPKWKKLGKVSRKAVFYSDVSVVLLSGQFQIRSADLSLHSKKKSRKIPKLLSATNMGGLVSTLLSIRPLVERGIVIPLPGEMEFSVEQEQISSEVVAGYNTIIDSIKKDKIQNIVVPVSLDMWAIRRQIEEIKSTLPRLSGLRPVYIYLPHLSNISIDTLICIREDNYDSFIRFQQALRSFLIESALVKSERAFLELARKVDYEVSELKLNIDKIERDGKMKGWEIVGGLIASSLTLLVDVEIAKYIGVIIGSKTTFESLKFLLGRPYAYRTIEDSDYYLAYKVHLLSDKESIKEG